MILPKGLQECGPELLVGSLTEVLSPRGLNQLLLPQPNNFCLNEEGWQILPLHPHLLSHNQTSEEWKKTPHLICERAEGTSQEVETCSCQMEWLIKLLSLSKDACASSLQCTGKQLQFKMFKSLNKWILSLFTEIKEEVAALSCTMQAGAVPVAEGQCPLHGFQLDLERIYQSECWTDLQEHGWQV